MKKKKERPYERRGLVFVTLVDPLGEFDESETFTKKSHLSCFNSEGKEVSIVVALGELYERKNNMYERKSDTYEKIITVLRGLDKDDSYISSYLKSVYLNIPPEKIIE